MNLQHIHTHCIHTLLDPSLDGETRISWYSQFDSRDSSTISRIRSQLQYMCSNDFETAIGYKAYTCTFDGTPSEASTFDDNYRVYHTFDASDCTTTSTSGLINEVPYGDNCLVFLRSFAHYANHEEGEWYLLTPGENYNDEIYGPGITFVLPTDENGNAYLQATYLCPTSNVTIVDVSTGSATDSDSSNTNYKWTGFEIAITIIAMAKMIL